jgi:hypothetical protein
MTPGRKPLLPSFLSHRSVLISFSTEIHHRRLGFCSHHQFCTCSRFWCPGLHLNSRSLVPAASTVARLHFPARKPSLHFLCTCDFAARIQGSFLLVLRSDSSTGQRTLSPQPLDLVHPTSFLAPGFHFTLPLFTMPVDFSLFW